MGITASGGHVVLTGADASVSFSDFSVKFHGKVGSRHSHWPTRLSG